MRCIWAVNEAERRSTGVTAVHSYQLHGDPSPLAALEQHLYDDARTKAHAQATALADQVVNGSRIPAGAARFRGAARSSSSHGSAVVVS